MLTTWQILDVGLLAALSAVLLLWDDELLKRVPYLAQRDLRASLDAAVQAFRREGTVTPAQRRALQVWTAGVAVALGVILLPLDRWLGIVAGGGLGLVAVLLPTAFRGSVPERRAQAVDDAVLSFLVHVRLKIDEGLVPALESYARGYDNVLAEEIDELVQIFNTGADIDELFAGLARKYDNPYLRDFAASLRELREQSEPAELVAAFLRQSIKEMRADRLQRIEQRIILSVSVGVLCLLPGLFLVLLEPGIFIFLQNFGG